MATLQESLELAPGVHRLETVEDGKMHGYHVVEGRSGLVVLDPGFATAPTDVYGPFLDEGGWTWDDVSMALVTHVDPDHHGGLHDLRSHAGTVVSAAHAADAPLMESGERMIDERHSMFAADHGIRYDEEVYDWLRGMLGPDEPIDLRFTGGEELRLADRTMRTLHTPGHTAGHLMLHDPTHDVVLGGDGFFGRGLFDVDGEYLQPPPYYLYPAYEQSIRYVEALDPDVLSFTHYDVLRGDEIDDFVEESLAFVREIETLALDVLDDHGTITLRAAIEAVVDRRGSFGLDDDLAFPLSAHYTDHVRRGDLETTAVDGVVAWRRTD
jgi:glyoxylase-like metal-dependent hydrolase (beta-lactamase superfamily II)